MQKALESFSIFFKKKTLTVLTVLGILNSLTYSLNFLNIDNVVGIVFRAIVASLFILYVVIGFIFNKYKSSIFLIVACSIYLIINTINVFTSPSTYEVSVSTIQLIESIAQSIINIFCINLVYFMINNKDYGKKDLFIPINIFVCFGLFLCVYTYIFQFESIINTFKPISEECRYCSWNADVTSIYNVKTVYGFMLLMAFFGSFIGSFISKKRFGYCLSFFFVINMLISRSKTSLLTVFIFFILFVIYNRKKIFIKKNAIIICSFLFAFLTLIFLTFFKVSSFFETLNNFILRTMIQDGLKVFNLRLERWKTTINSINFYSLFFGLGERIANVILINKNGFGPSDNAFIYTLCNSGIILIVVCFYLMIKTSLKSHKQLWIFLFAFLINFMFENNGVIGLAYCDLVIIILIVAFCFDNLSGDCSIKTNN